MYKKMFFLLGMITLSVQSAMAAVEAVSPELEGTLKNTSNEPSALTILFSLCFVIALIYVTGVIYSKLNLVGAKAVKEQLKNYDMKKAVIISTTQLGQNKNLHVIELNHKQYLIGATPNSINLLKELDTKSPEQSPDKQGISEVTKVNAINEGEEIDDAIHVLYRGHDEKLSEVKESENDEFDIHKKYL